MFVNPREIKPGVYAVGAIDWDRRLFDALIGLPDGTTYNSYLVEGREKTALFDTVDPEMTAVLLENLKGVEKVDFIVLQHAEQDHSGSLSAVLQRFPDAQVMCSARAVEILSQHLGFPEATFIVVKDGQELDLGGKTLRFLATPWAHWPETMSTYIAEDRLLLSCDMFGAHFAGSDAFWGERDPLPSAKRYFAEIMMPFRPALRKNLDKVRSLEVDMIAPSHGPVFDRPSVILGAYEDWLSGPPRNLVVIPYITMHGSTSVMVDRLVQGLIDRSVGVARFDVTSLDTGHLAMDLVDAATVVIGTPTVMTNPHPAMIGVIYLINLLRPKVKFMSAVVTHGWASNAIETIQTMTSGLKPELIPPVLLRGMPAEDGLRLIDELADAIAAKHREAGLL